MNIRLSDHFTFSKLIRFTVPSIVMMLFTSIYGVVDGLFISNIVGSTAFAAVNMILPYCYIFAGVGSVFGIGGSALMARMKGEGDGDKANRLFTLLVIVMAVLGVVFAVPAEIFLPEVIDLLGADDAMRGICLEYGRIFLLTLPAFLLQYGFQSYMITAERPQIGLAFTVGAGVVNMFLDWLFVALLGWGVQGAAAATCIGQCIGGIVPIFYFLIKRDLPLKFVKTTFMPRQLLKAAGNGSADGITNIAISVVNVVFNMQLMKYVGEYGVAAYGIIMYVNFVFIALYLGYSAGIAPAFSFHFGSGNTEELKSLLKKSLIIIGVTSVGMTVVAISAAGLIAGIFAGYDPLFLEVSTRALRLYSLSDLLAGFNLFVITLYAALNDGKTSAILSVLRMFVFQIAAVLLLPLWLEVDGIWLAMLTAEIGVIFITVPVLIRDRKKYHYA